MSTTTVVGILLGYASVALVRVPFVVRAQREAAREELRATKLDANAARIAAQSELAGATEGLREKLSQARKDATREAARVEIKVSLFRALRFFESHREAIEAGEQAMADSSVSVARAPPSPWWAPAVAALERHGCENLASQLRSAPLEQKVQLLEDWTFNLHGGLEEQLQEFYG